MGWNNLSVNLAPQQNQLLNLSHSAQNSWQVSGALDSEGLRKDTQGLKDSFNDIMKPLIDREIGDQYFQKKEEVKQSKLAELSKGNEDIYKQLKEKQALKDFITSEADEASQMAFGTNLTNASKTLDAYAMNNGYVDMTAMLAAAQSGDQQANRKLMSSGIGDIAKQVSTLNTQYKRLMTQPLDYSDYEQLGEAAYRKGLVSSVQEGIEKYIWAKDGNGILQLQEQGLKSANDSIAQNKWVNQHFSQDQLKPNERPQRVSNQTPQIHSQYNNQTLTNQSQKSTLDNFKFELENTEQTQQDTTLPTDTKPTYLVEGYNGRQNITDEESLSQLNNLKNIASNNPQNLTIDDFSKNEKAIEYLGLDESKKKQLQQDIKSYKIYSERLSKNPQINEFLQKYNLKPSQLVTLNPTSSEYKELQEIKSSLSPDLHASFKSLENFNMHNMYSDTIARLNKTNIVANNPIPQQTKQDKQTIVNEAYQNINTTLNNIIDGKQSIEEVSTQLAENYETLARNLSEKDFNDILKKIDMSKLPQKDIVKIQTIHNGYKEASNNLLSFVAIKSYGHETDSDKDPQWIKDGFKEGKFSTSRENSINLEINTVENINKELGIFNTHIPADKIKAVNALNDTQIDIKNFKELNSLKISSNEDFKKILEDDNFIKEFNNAITKGFVFSPDKIISNNFKDKVIINKNGQTIDRNGIDAYCKAYYLIQKLIDSKQLTRTKETGAIVKDFLTKWITAANGYAKIKSPNQFNIVAINNKGN